MNDAPQEKHRPKPDAVGDPKRPIEPASEAQEKPKKDKPPYMRWPADFPAKH